MQILLKIKIENEELKIFYFYNIVEKKFEKT